MARSLLTCSQHAFRGSPHRNPPHGDEPMSFFGSMTTALTGIRAQSSALGHISDNIANSQTVGFKRTDTAFQDIVTASTSRNHLPGAVLAAPAFTNSV